MEVVVMNVLIVDDDKSFTSVLENDIYTFFQKKQDKANITVVNNNFKELNMINKYHIAFLDIDLITDDGLKIAKELRDIDNNVLIVFVSSRSNLVFKSFVVKPFYFLRKSHYKVDLIYFFEMLDNYFKKKTLISLDSRSTKVHIPVDSIVYVESHEHQLSIHSKSEIYFHSSSLHHFLQNLSNTNFVQIHKSYVINLDYLKGIEKAEVLLIENIRLPIGRKYRDSFYESYQDYLIK
jgi:DNA-binding LytR/AlgR family response regulator